MKAQLDVLSDAHHKAYRKLLHLIRSGDTLQNNIQAQHLYLGTWYLNTEGVQTTRVIGGETGRLFPSFRACRGGSRPLVPVAPWVRNALPVAWVASVDESARASKGGDTGRGAAGFGGVTCRGALCSDGDTGRDLDSLCRFIAAAARRTAAAV